VLGVRVAMPFVTGVLSSFVSVVLVIAQKAI
jgi:hypothetical protein